MEKNNELGPRKGKENVETETQDSQSECSSLFSLFFFGGGRWARTPYYNIIAFVVGFALLHEQVCFAVYVYMHVGTNLFTWVMMNQGLRASSL